MNYLTRFFFLISLQLLLLPAESQDLRISGHFQGSGVKDVFNQIESNYPLRFFYLDQWLPKQAVDHQFDQQPLSEVLNKLLQDSDLTYLIYHHDKIIIGKKDQLADPASSDYFMTRQAMSATEIDGRFPLLKLGIQPALTMLRCTKSPFISLIRMRNKVSMKSKSISQSSNAP